MRGLAVFLSLGLWTGWANAADPPPPPPPATPPATTAPPQAPTVTINPNQQAAANALKLRDIERRVNELKEQVFRSKARLNLLKETVLHGVIAGSRAVVVHRNEMGATYKLIQYSFALDGNEISSKADPSGKLADQKETEVWNGSVVPGNHTLSVQLVYQGNGAIFTYMKGYTFTAKSSHAFTASEGKQLTLKVVGYEKGNPITTDPKDRPAVDFREQVMADKDVVSAKTGADSGKDDKKDKK